MTDIKHFCVNENIEHLMHHLCTGQKYKQLKLKKYPGRHTCAAFRFESNFIQIFLSFKSPRVVLFQEEL